VVNITTAATASIIGPNDVIWALTPPVDGIRTARHMYAVLTDGIVILFIRTLPDFDDASADGTANGRSVNKLMDRVPVGKKK
jgi:hypothetical protein